MSLERDVAFMAVINKAMEMNNISMNKTKDARYANIGTLLFNIQQTLQDGIRENYVDTPLEEVDSSKYRRTQAEIEEEETAKKQAANTMKKVAVPKKAVKQTSSNNNDDEDV